MATFTVPKVFTRRDKSGDTYKVSVDVVLDIDIDEVSSQLGWKALVNKSNKSRGLGGAIIARAKNARRLS